MKRLLTTLFLSVLILAAFAQAPSELQITKKAIHPRYRQWAAPAGGVAVQVNPPSLLWPVADKKDNYRVRMSQDSTFTRRNDVISSGTLQWAQFSAHRALSPGKWYWQYATISPEGKESWSDTFSFVISKDTRVFESMTPDELVSKVELTPHPRMYVTSDELEAFRKKNSANPEAQQIIRRADKNLDLPLMKMEPTRPRDTTGLNAFEKKNMITFMYHQFGDKVKAPIENFCIAYLLTGDEKYIRAAIPHVMNVAAMPQHSDATGEDFNRVSIMEALAIAYDTGYQFFTPEQRAVILASIKERGDHFFAHYAKEFETHSMDNHVWQHAMRRFLFTSLATAGDLQDADKWLAYLYETWSCRFPVLGADDGGWHDGSSYFQVNFQSFIYIPFMLSKWTGADFFDVPWLKNLPMFLIYSFPKDSYSTGFGDGYEAMTQPKKGYISFADALARETNNGYARWYTDQLLGGDPEKLITDGNLDLNFSLYRMLTDVKYTDVKPVTPEKEAQGKLFRDAGFALMHTDVADASKDLMVTFMDIPFGATGHAHAAHNAFTINLGGKEMFGGTGYYSHFNDAHTMKHYRTRGHNTIVVDGMSPAIGENGYGWIARFADNGTIGYVLGDATHAFDQMTTPFWIDRMKQAGIDYSLENGFGNPGVTRYRRHFVFLRPDIVVIYDELAAKKPVTWTWLLHSYHKMTRGGGASKSLATVFSQNEAGKARFDLFTNEDITTKVTDKFFAPAANWRSKTKADGTVTVYDDQWHAEFETTGKTAEMRFLGIFQIEKTTDGNAKFLTPAIKDGLVKIGEWTIHAQMDGSKPASLVVKDKDGNAVVYNKEVEKVGKSTVSPKVQGATLLVKDGKVTQELIDVVPAAALQGGGLSGND